MKRLILVLALACVPFVAFADEDAGEEKKAGSFSAGEMLYDADVVAKTLEDCRGEVVMIKLWGLDCGPCKAAMPSVQRLWDQKKDRGFHLFHLESQGHSVDEVRAYCEKNGFSFPQSFRSGSDFSSFPGGSGLPYAYVIGVDGTIIFEGSHGYDAVIHAELEKVRYPGLGKSEVVREVHKAASLFAGKRYGKAVAEANKVKAKHEDNADVVADADFVVSKVDAIGARIEKAAQSALTGRDYDIAFAKYSEISKTFKGLPLGDNAKKELAKFKKDRAIKKELKALQAYGALCKSIKRQTFDRQKTQLEAFAKAYEGTRAAEKATKKASSLSSVR